MRVVAIGEHTNTKWRAKQTQIFELDPSGHRCSSIIACVNNNQLTLTVAVGRNTYISVEFFETGPHYVAAIDRSSPMPTNGAQKRHGRTMAKNSKHLCGTVRRFGKREQNEWRPYRDDCGIILIVEPHLNSIFAINVVITDLLTYGVSTASTETDNE